MANRPQQLAYASNANVVGYGGAAGGGKTDLLLGMALTKFSRSAYYRLVAGETNAALERARDLTGIREGPIRVDGRTLEFIGLFSDKQVRAQQGIARDLMAFDEATAIPESSIRFVMNWNRSSDPTAQPQTVLAFNPPMYPEQEWVIDWFAPWIDPAAGVREEPGTVLWVATIDGREEFSDNPDPVTWKGETLRKTSRTFFAARLEDNRHLADTDYAAKLDADPNRFRRDALRKGIIIRNTREAPLQLIPLEWITEAQHRWEAAHAAADADGVTILEALGSPALTATGADVSRGGTDSTSVANRYGWYFPEIMTFRGEVTDRGYKTANLIMDANDGAAPIIVDVVAVGSSTFDFLELNHPSVIGFNGAARSGAHDPATDSWVYARDSSGKYRLANARAEAFERFRRLLDPVHGVSVMLPPGSDLARQLAAVRTRLIGAGLGLEKKEAIRDRLGRSPDDAEAVVYAAWEPLTPPRPNARVAMAMAGANRRTSRPRRTRR